jgi:hypothetical protein
MNIAHDVDERRSRGIQPIAPRTAGVRRNPPRDDNGAPCGAPAQNPIHSRSRLQRQHVSKVRVARAS